MPVLVGLICGLSDLVALTAGAAPPRPALTSARAVRELSPRQAGERRPARVRGVVTHVNPHRDDFFVHDGTAGLYVHPTPLAKKLKPGDRVRVEGVTDPGTFSPGLEASAVAVEGTADLPDPKEFSLVPAESRWLDGDWVRCRGVVRAVTADGDCTVLRLTDARGSAVVIVPGTERLASLRLLIDRAVEVVGVASALADDQRQVKEPARLFASAARVVALPASETVGDRPARLGECLKRFSPKPDPVGRLVTVAGTLTAAATPSLWFVESDGLGATVLLARPAEARVGGRFEITGLMRVQGKTITIAQASARPIPGGEAPAARDLTADQLHSRRHHGLRVRIEARLEEARERGGHTRLTLLDGAHRFDAYLLGSRDDALLALEPGSRLRVTAVAANTTLEGLSSPGAEPNIGLLLLLRTADEVEVLETPPAPPDTLGASRRLFFVLLALSAVLGLSFVWVRTLRVQLRRRAAEIHDGHRHQAQLEERLSQGQKMEAVGRLAGGIAHDFNNLLTVINGNSELARRQLPAGHPTLTLLGEIAQAGEKAAALTAQLLLFSRHKPVELTRMDLNAAVEEALGLLRRLIGEHIVIDSRAADVPMVLAAPGLVHQIVLNLAVNARDAMPRGGKLSIRTQGVADGAGRPFARVTVADTGCGMSERTLGHVFEPFFTTKEPGKGTGLGLATVYGIVQSLGGEIRVRSALDRGTTFEIDLPAAPACEEASGVVEPPPSLTPAADGAVVLLVEDEDAVRTVCRVALRMSGYQVVAADRPEEALNRFDELGGRIDLVITDVVMPGMSGRDLARAIRKRGSRVRILYMSGYVRDDLGYVDSVGEELHFIQKPFTPTALVAKVREMLGREERLPS